MLSDRNRANLMCRLADVQLQLRENSRMGLGRSAGEAQRGTLIQNYWPQVQTEPGNRFVRQSLIHLIGNIPPLLDPNPGRVT